MDNLENIGRLIAIETPSDEEVQELAREMHQLPDDQLLKIWYKLQEKFDLLVRVHPFIVYLIVNSVFKFPRPTWEQTLSGEDPAAGLKANWR